MYQKQCQLNPPCRDASIYTKTAVNLFYNNFKNVVGVRLLGITASDWCDENTQLSFFETRKTKKNIDNVVVKIRDKFGLDAIKKCNTLLDNKIAKTFINEHLDKNT